MSRMRIDRVYKNSGNYPLVNLLDIGVTRILDVGCGAGDNAFLAKTDHPSCQVCGITCSMAEAAIANRNLEHCWVCDIEEQLPADLAGQKFDALLFSHVLEHLRDPAAVLAKFVPLLHQGGRVLIAVPNVLSWRMRLQFVFGRFEYESAGVLDDTHLRFFTFHTADRLLFAGSPELSVVSKTATGNVPLWWLRRHLLPRSLSERIDKWGCRLWPNLFGDQILIKAIRK